MLKSIYYITGRDIDYFFVGIITWGWQHIWITVNELDSYHLHLKHILVIICGGGR